MAILFIEKEIAPQGHMEDATAQNANLALFDGIAGVDWPIVVYYATVVNTHAPSSCS